MDGTARAPGRRTRLCGRSSECAALDALLANIRRGRSRTLILRGEAGIGKTALLEYLVDSASDVTVLRAAGVESEMELAYASLHQLCAPLFDQLGTLPAPQRQALETAFALSAGSPPDRFLVGLGVLGLLSDIAGAHAVLCIVDDAQWLDHASALTLAFIARRLLADSVGIVFAAREPGEELAQLPELEVRGVRNGDARELLSSAIPFRLDERVRDRLVAETHGNPLALLELPRGLTATQLAGGFGLPEARGLTGRIEESFVRRLAELSDDTRRLLLIAAAEPVGDPLLLWRAADSLAIEPPAAAKALASGLVSIDERVTFRHPLVRSAVYRQSSQEDRQAVHLALAEATDSQADPDRRAWHLAAATVGADEEVAIELERCAGRAQARGGLAASAAFMRRAVALSQDPKRRGDRALAAAQASFQTGAFDAARGLVAEAEHAARDDFQRARVDLARAQMEFMSMRGSDAPPLLLAAAKLLEPLDLTLARETYLEALMAAQLAGRFASGAVLEVARAARQAPASGSPRACDILLDALALTITEGHVAGAPLLRRALETFRDGDDVANGGFRWLFLAEMAAIELWDYDAWRELTVREVKLVRDAGAITVLATALSVSIYVRIFAGELAAAASLIEEQRIITEASGSRLAPHAALILAAWRGQQEELSELTETTMRDAVPRGEGIGVSATQWVRALLCNALGEHEGALAAAQELMSPPRSFDQAIGWALPELIEAAVRTGHRDVAHDALVQLSEMTRPGGTDWGLGIEARCRALLGEDDLAEEFFREAIERLGRTPVRGELARAHLLYGEWLRSQRDGLEAREQLRIAHRMLTDMGMRAFAERARKELVATGEKVTERVAEESHDLTAQERQIAQLARDGLSNPEIGARLFLSPRTVEWHLRKVFTKLGVRSRRDLARALSSMESELAIM